MSKRTYTSTVHVRLHELYISEVHFFVTMVIKRFAIALHICVVVYIMLHSCGKVEFLLDYGRQSPKHLKGKICHWKHFE